MSSKLTWIGPAPDLEGERQLLRSQVQHFLVFAATQGVIPNGTTGALDLLRSYDNAVELARTSSRDTTTDFPTPEGRD